MNEIVNSFTGVDQLQRQLDRIEVIAWVALVVAVISLVLHAFGNKK